MPINERFKRRFQTWEKATGAYLDEVLRSPSFTERMGAVLMQLVRAKKAARGLRGAAFGALGLPSRQEQERTLHALNEIRSKLLDLEERLEEGHPAGQRGLSNETHRRTDT